MQLDEVVGMSLHVEADAVALEVGDELLDGAEPLLLTAAGLVAVSGELGGDLPDVDLVGELEQAAPVGHLGAPLLLVGRGPVEDRVEGAHLDARLLLGLVELGDEGVVCGGAVVPEVEVRVG